MTNQLQAPAEWEQMDDEPDKAYEHFTYYLYSPRPRSIKAALLAMNPNAKSADSWYRESKLYAWHARAHAFDVHQITEHGQEVVVNMVDAMRLLSRKLLKSLSQDGADWTYEQTITAFRLLGELVPAETVAALRTTAGSGDTPAIGSRPVTVNTIVVDFSAIAPGSVGDSFTSGEAESRVQRAPVGEDDDGRIVGSGSSVARLPSAVDSTDIQEHTATVAMG